MSEQNGQEIAAPKNGIQQALMAKSETHPAIKGLSELSIARQIGIMLGLALSVAIGIAIVLWSQEPSYSRLYSEIGEKDVTEILEVLNTQGIKYKVENGSGAIMVPSDDLDQVKLKLAGLGLPRSNSTGYDLLSKDQSFGASKNLEMIRFQRALEGEIAQTIMSIQSVKSARVLLALPQQSVFVRERKKPSASVVVNLYQGRSLDKGQIESIIHLVASSVPQLEADQVTVVDQKGQLLNSKDSASVSYLTSKQFEYKKNFEDHLMERIENILAPLVGNGMRVQISADLDFTETDKTQELFDPKSSVLRSEQTSEEQNKLPGIQGVPGALSNQPSAVGTAPQTPPAAATPPSPGAAPNSTTSATDNNPSSSSKNATRNFEVDKTITHTRSASGAIRRLSVAVVVDDQRTVQADGKATSQPYKPEDITRFTDLVKQAVGFDNARGDQVTVTNVAFKAPEAPEALPEIPLWQQPWFLNLMKQVAGVLAVVFIVFGVLRPTMRNLSGANEAKKAAALAAEKAAEEGTAAATGELVDNPEGGTANPALGSQQQGQAALPFSIDELLQDNQNVPQHYGQRLEYLQKMVDENPQLVAQVLKRWVR